MAEKIEIAKLEFDTSELVKNVTEATKALNDLKEKEKELKASTEDQTEALLRNTIAQRNVRQSIADNQKILTTLIDTKGKDADITDKTTKAYEREVKSIESARKNNSELNDIRNKLDLTTEEGRKTLVLLNKKLDENNAFIKENADAYLKQKINIGNYKDSIKEAFNELNIFNGGIGGFIQRSKDAGGVGNLVSGAFKTMATGIGGITRASLTFLATPIGAVIGVLGVTIGLLVNYLKSTQSGIDKVTAVTRPLQAIFQSLIGVVQGIGEKLFKAFSEPKKTLSELADFVKTNLINRFKAFGVILDGILTLDTKKIANGVLQAGTGIENMTDKIKSAGKQTAQFFEEAVKKGQEVDRLTKELQKSESKFVEDTARMKEQFKDLNKLSEDTNKPLSERIEATKKSIKIQEQINKLALDRLDSEIKLLEVKQSFNDTSDEEVKQLAELKAKRNATNAEFLEVTTTQQNKVNSLINESNAKAKELAQKKLDDALAKNKLEIDIFIAQQGVKAKSLEEEVKIAEAVATKKLALNDKEFKAKKITAEQHKLNQITIQNELLQAQTEATLAFAQIELDRVKEQNKQKIDANLFYSEQILQQEKNRLANLLEAEKEYLAKKLEQGVISQREYNSAINALDEENRVANEEAEKVRAEAKKEQEAVNFQLEQENRALNRENEFEIQRIQAEREYEMEMANARKSGADVSLIEAKYAKIREDIKKQEILAKNELVNASFDVASNVFKKETAVGKAVALAKSIFNTYEAISKANTLVYPANIPAIAQATLTGFGAVKNIIGTQTPKFEQGGLMEIGGNRHSAGGTKFWGEDGTTFEAEKGELIGVMSRTASRAFMDFNNSYISSSSKGNYFANGGIVQRSSGSSDDAIKLMQEAIKNIPAPIVDVKDIISEVQNRVSLIDGANR
jgi:hypothetical protein